MCRNGRRGGLKIPCANNTCGFDPHHRHKKEALQLVWGASFLSAACERVEQHDPAQQGSNQPCGLLLSARETPTTGITKDPQLWLGVFCYFLFRASGSFSHFCLLREDPDDGIGRRYLAGEIQMCINVACSADIAVPQPLLNFLQAHAIGIEQTGVGRGNGYASSGVLPENLGNAGSGNRAESAFP